MELSKSGVTKTPLSKLTIHDKKCICGKSQPRLYKKGLLKTYKCHHPLLQKQKREELFKFKLKHPRHSSNLCSHSHHHSHCILFECLNTPLGFNGNTNVSDIKCGCEEEDHAVEFSREVMFPHQWLNDIPTAFTPASKADFKTVQKNV